MHKPLVSILMPAYNAEKFIGAAIKSILKQTFADFELVIINDGSIDNTEEIIKSFSDYRISYHKYLNQGVARSLNLGLKKCKGTYIRRHDADDISTADALEKQLKFLENNPHFSIVSSKIAFMTENGKIAYNFTNPGSDFFKNEYYIEVSKSNYWQNRPIVHATVLAKKSLFEDVGGYRTEFPTAEDIDLWFRILEKQSVAIINECNYYVRLHGTSNTAIHGERNIFYRNLAYELFKERQEGGWDKLSRGEMPSYVPEDEAINLKINNEKLSKQHKLFRNDILDYYYKVFVDAKDWKMVIKSIIQSIKDGWKLKRTWKALVFPLLGDRIVKLGVKIKGTFK